MEHTNHPVTPAIRLLREKRISFEPHLYDYKEHGGTSHAAASLGVSEHAVIKTLVLETDERKPLLMLMHGDREVSTKQLARALGVRSVAPCNPATAHKHTGYQIGGTSPFGTRARLPVYAERTIFDLPEIYINGGKRGFLVKINSLDLRAVFEVKEVEAAIATL